MTEGGLRLVAAFDFDGTLTKGDTFVPFLAAVAGPARLARALAAESASLVRVAAGRGDRDALKEALLTRLLAGTPFDTVVELGRVYGAGLAACVRPEMRERVAAHRRAGHEVVIVSASLDVYLEPVARELGAEALLCTRLEAGDDGLCTGALLGANCRGEEKATRLRTYLGASPVRLWAYGDSAGDDAMLAMADHPVRVRRSRRPHRLPPLAP